MRNIFVMTAKPMCSRNGQALPVICMCGIEVSSTLSHPLLLIPTHINMSVCTVISKSVSVVAHLP